jgi:hypothetical protein
MIFASQGEISKERYSAAFSKIGLTSFPNFGCGDEIVNRSQKLGTSRDIHLAVLGGQHSIFDYIVKSFDWLNFFSDLF